MGDSEDLAAKLRWAIAHPQEMAVMGRHARSQFESEYSPSRNYGRLMEIYQRARAA
jgi:glycosyltransferase involved in cell wall biosynthesis